MSERVTGHSGPSNFRAAFTSPDRPRTNPSSPTFYWGTKRPEGVKYAHLAFVIVALLPSVTALICKYVRNQYHAIWSGGTPSDEKEEVFPKTLESTIRFLTLLGHPNTDIIRSP
jgi:hypothetical protein